MNITNAVRQMRIARRLGKISNDQQSRILRKLGVNPLSQWERMRGMLESIKAEPGVKEKIQAMRQAERDLFQIKFAPDATLPKEPTPLLTALQTRLMDAKNRCLAKQAKQGTITLPKKRGRKSKAELAAIAAAKAAELMAA